MGMAKGDWVIWVDGEWFVSIPYGNGKRLRQFRGLRTQMGFNSLWEWQKLEETEKSNPIRSFNSLWEWQKFPADKKAQEEIVSIPYGNGKSAYIMRP